MMASAGPGFGSGLSVAVKPGCAEVLTSARMTSLYTRWAIPPTLAGKNGLRKGVEIGRMQSMKALPHRSLMLVGICCVAFVSPCLIVPAYSESSPQTASSSSPTKRWAQFELSQAESMGDPQTGKPVTLTIVLGGVTAGTAPVV